MLTTRAALLTLVALMAVACTGPTAPSNTRVIAVSGTIDFGDVIVGKDVTRSFVIENRGKAELTVSNISSGPLSDVVQLSARPMPFAIPPASSASVFVTFKPTTTQSYVGTVKVTADQTSGTDVVEVRGNGLPLPKANIQTATGGSYACYTGYCVEMTFPIVNLGPGCARDTTVVSRAYGNNGNGPQLGVDIPMDVGGGLRFITIYPNQTVWLYSMTGFNDVRSAFTVFRNTITWRDVPCP